MTEGEQKRRAFVIDDDVSIVSLVTCVLEDENYSVKAFFDAREALKVAQKWRPDIVFSDVMMPKMSGPELLKQLDENELTRGIPFVFITAIHDSQNQELVNYIANKRAAYLPKPFDINEIEIKAKEARRNAGKKFNK